MIDCYFTKITRIFGYGWVLEDGAQRPRPTWWAHLFNQLSVLLCAIIYCYVLYKTMLQDAATERKFHDGVHL